MSLSHKRTLSAGTLLTGSELLLSTSILYVQSTPNHRMGIPQVCLDLVCNVQFYRSQNPEVEVFARFLEESYGSEELDFFL